MGILLVKICRQIAGVRILVGMGTFVVLALVIAFIAGNARAAGSEEHPINLSRDGDSSGILLAAKDTPKTDAAAKNATASNSKAPKDTKDAKAKADFARGVYLSKITRGATSVNVPILAQTTVNRGDILKFSGTKTHIKRIEAAIGYADRPSDMTDLVWVGLFIYVSGMIGALSVKVGGVPLTLSVSMGVLVGGHGG